MKIARFRQAGEASGQPGVVREGRVVPLAAYSGAICARAGLRAPERPASIRSLIEAGWLEADASRRIEAIVSEIVAGAHCARVSEVQLLPPVDEGCQVFGVGRNFEAHAKERGAPVSTEPVVFLKSSTSLIGCGDNIVVDPAVGRVDHEAEMAVVIGMGGLDISEEEAGRHIAGFTCMNDVTARDLQNPDAAKGLPWTRAKGRATFGPIGPWLVTPDEIGLEPETEVACRVNGQERQRGNTSQMTHSVARVISYISSICPLKTGDIIAMGTPAGIGPLEPGDLVEVEVEGVGVLSNPVVAKERA